MKRTSRFCYESAMDAIASGLMAVCVPGELDGELVVRTIGYGVPLRDRRYAEHRDSLVRAAWAVGAVREARRSAREVGIVVDAR